MDSTFDTWFKALEHAKQAAFEDYGVQDFETKEYVHIPPDKTLP